VTARDVVEENEVAVELDGPGVSPTTVPSVDFLAFSTAFFELLQQLLKSEMDSAPAVEFMGIRVLDKCAALAIRTTDTAFTKKLADYALRLVTGEEEPPDNCVSFVDEVRLRRRATPHVTRVLVGKDWSRGVATVQAPSELRVWAENTVMRVIPVRIGGKEQSTVVLEAEGESKTFTLNVSRLHVRDLARHLYEPVEAELRISRDLTGRIRSGSLLNFRPIETTDALEAWRDWYKENLSHLDAVEDLEAERGHD
jgi:hypothetical protein